MFQLNPNKNWGVCLFVCVSGRVLVFTFWPYILCFVVLYAIGR